MTGAGQIRQSIQTAREVLTLRQPRLQRLALDWGLVRGRRDYARFILLGRSRTGSNLIRGLLNAHSGVTVLGEIFKNPEAVEWGMPGFPQGGRSLELYRTQPIRFLEEHVFPKMPSGTQALGFKIFYYHASAHPWTAIWGHLQADRELRVIHIKRSNILRTHLSRARAERSSRWVNVSGEREEGEPIRIDPQACLADFERTRRWEREHDDLFRDHPMIEVLYEDLASDLPGAAERIQGFLGLSRESLTPQTHKQAREPLSRAIENYRELEAFFHGTPWESFFDEQADRS